MLLKVMLYILQTALKKHFKHLKINNLNLSCKKAWTEYVPAEVFLKKRSFITHTALSFLAELCIAGVFLLLFCLQSFSVRDCYEYENAYTAGTFNTDFAVACCNSRKSNFSGSKTLSADDNSEECLPGRSYDIVNALLTARRGQSICSGFNLNCEFIACTAPPRAGPCFFWYTLY